MAETIKKDLKYFMRSTEAEVVTAPGPESFKDEEGNVIQFEIKVLTQEEINKINDAYRKHSMATDKKGNPLVYQGEVIWKTEKDNARASRHLVVEALQFPNQGQRTYGLLQLRGRNGYAAQGIQQGGRIPARPADCYAGPRPHKRSKRR